MATLNYADLMDEVNEKALKLEHPRGTLVFRPLDALNGEDLKKMLKLVDIVQDEKIATETRLDTMVQILVAACEDKVLAKEAFKDMPLKIVQTIFSEWAGGEEQGNS